MSDPPPEDELAHPLDRLTSGGWWRGLLRMSVGMVIVAVVLWVSGEEAWGPLLDLRLVPFVLSGAALHLAQRSARVRKWYFMIRDANLLERSFFSLLRVQLIGLMINLVLPLSEGLKAWSVSRNRRDLVVAGKSLVADMALHTSFIGLAGLVGVVIHGVVQQGDASWVSWLLSLLFAFGAMVVMLAIHYFTKEQASSVRFLDRSVLLWCAVETALQVAVYVLAVEAMGLSPSLPVLLALAPLLYVSDLIMVTPQGVGLREVVFAGAVALLEGASPQAGVSMGLVISAMLLAASIVGGGVGLLLPDKDAPKR